jgi:hypothetical protein
MTLMKSTPGPWKWYKADPPVRHDDGAPTDDLWNALEHDPLTPGIPTVLTWCYSREKLEDVQVRCSVADAALIAEAPALLKSLEDCVAALEIVHASMPRHNCTVDCPDIDKHVAHARAIIVRAEGRP